MRDLLVAGALASLAGLGLFGCGSDDCADTLTCDGAGGSGAGTTQTGGQGQGGNGGGGGGAGGAGVGGAGGTAPRCGNGSVEAGELCFTNSAVEYTTTSDGPVVDLAVQDCDGNNTLDVLAITADTSAGMVSLINSGGQLSGVISVIAVDTPVAFAVGADIAPNGGAYLAYPGGGYFDRYINDGSCSYSYDTAFYPSSSVTSPAGIAVAALNTSADDLVYTAVGGGSNKLVWRLDWSGGGTDVDVISNGPMVAAAFDAMVGDDIAVISHQDRVAVHLWGGTSFNNALYTTVGANPSAIAAANVGGDVRSDVVVTNADDGTISVLINQGSGTLIRQTPDPTVGIGQAAPGAVALGDMDGDGDVDAVTANCGVPSAVSVLVNDGDGAFTLGGFGGIVFPMAVPDEATSVAVADLNGDGALDIIVGHAVINSDGSHVSVLLQSP